MNARSTRNVFVYLLILVAMVLVVVMVFRPATASSEKPKIGRAHVTPVTSLSRMPSSA